MSCAGRAFPSGMAVTALIRGSAITMGYGYYDGAAAGFVLFAIFLSLIFALAGYALVAWFLMKIFDKAGVQGKWRAWVPVYNMLVFAKLGDVSPWMMLIGLGLAVVPYLNFITWVIPTALSLMIAWRVGLKLQKEAVWVVLYFFLSIVWLGILAFDRSRWNTAVPPAPWANSFLADTTVWQGVPNQVPAGGYPPPGGGQPGYPAPGAYPPPGYQPPPAGYQPPAAPPSSAPGSYPPPASPEPPAAPGPDDPNAPRT